MSLVIVDTGCANISSVYCAFQRLGVDAKVSRDLSVIKKRQPFISAWCRRCPSGDGELA